METIQKNSITLKLIFQENWDSFLANHQSMVTLVYGLQRLEDYELPRT